MEQLDRDVIRAKYFPMIRNFWNASSNDFPAFLIENSKDMKKQNEAYLEECMNTVERQRKAYSRIEAKKWYADMQRLIIDMMTKQTITVNKLTLSESFIESFQQELLLFVRHARKSAPQLTFEGLGQAIRNYMVFAMFKKIHELETDFSYAAFGYSMLYPVTDNYIDDVSISSQQKQEYNELIQRKIAGEIVSPTSFHQRQTCEFLDAIESEFPREVDSTVFLLLQMMLEAQIDSLKQQNKNILLEEQERLAISIAKGGLSVFIDRYLIKKEMTEADIVFYLGFGLFLQLADDLQDIEEDSLKGGQTVFTMDTSQKVIEQKVNQLLHFTHDILCNYEIADQSFKEFVSYSSYQLILSSVMRSRKYFSKTYIKNIERFMPVSIHYLDQMKQSMNRQVSKKNEQKLFEFLDTMLGDLNEDHVYI